MLESGMPRLDKRDLQQFSLPFTDHPVTFKGHPLAPPEGYMAINFMKDIHRDGHWEGCPWGVYWTLLRHKCKTLWAPNLGQVFSCLIMVYESSMHLTLALYLMFLNGMGQDIITMELFI